MGPRPVIGDGRTGTELITGRGPMLRTVTGDFRQAHEKTKAAGSDFGLLI